MIRTIVGILALLAAGCTFNIAPNATDGSLLTVRGGNVTVPASEPVGSNGVLAAAGTEPKSTSEKVVYLLFAIATAAYPIWRKIRRWIWPIPAAPAAA